MHTEGLFYLITSNQVCLLLLLFYFGGSSKYNEGISDCKATIYLHSFSHSVIHQVSQFTVQDVNNLTRGTSRQSCS